MEKRVQRARSAAVRAATEARAERQKREQRGSWTLTLIALAVLAAVLLLKLQFCDEDTCYAGAPVTTKSLPYSAETPPSEGAN